MMQQVTPFPLRENVEPTHVLKQSRQSHDVTVVTITMLSIRSHVSFVKHRRTNRIAVLETN